jgi:Ca2+-binding EF-hand superfamily protein
MDAAVPAVCKTGEFWIYKDTKDFITLFGTYSEDKDGTIEFGEVITIPKKWI